MLFALALVALVLLPVQASAQSSGPTLQDVLVMRSVGVKIAFPEDRGETRAIENETPAELARADIIDFNGLPVRRLPPWLRSFSGIRELRMRDTRLRLGGEPLLNELVSLEVLDIGDNPDLLDNVDSFAASVAHLTKLKVLRLDGLDANEAKIGSLGGFSRLRDVSLSDNRISDLSQLGLSALSLLRLDISQNRVSRIRQQDLPWKTLRDFDMSFNQVRDGLEFFDMPSLARWDISGNVGIKVPEDYDGLFVLNNLRSLTFAQVDGVPSSLKAKVLRNNGVRDCALDGGFATPPTRDLAVWQICPGHPYYPEMVVIPAGRFLMGSPSNEASRSSNEGPQREVSIRRFAMSKTEVTFDQWQTCVDGGGCKSNPKPIGAGRGRGSHPVTFVSWDDVQEYIAWLNGAVGASVYRLPSEAEWEYSARAGTTTPFWTGDTISTDQANYDGNYVYGSGRKGIYRRETVPVGSFKVNPFGLNDMHGNVREWVEDCYGTYTNAPMDGSPALSRQAEGCSRRVLRGGSWYYTPANLRSANRDRLEPGDPIRDKGFRLARTLTH